MTFCARIYIYNYILSNQNCSDTANYSIEIYHQSDASIIHPGIICDNIDTITLNAAEGEVIGLEIK